MPKDRSEADPPFKPKPGAWDRFRDAVHVIGKTPPAHKEKAAEPKLGGEGVDPKPSRKRQPG